MKKNRLTLQLTLLLCAFHPCTFHAQTVPWAISGGNADPDQGYDISADAQGNIYVTG